MKKKQLSLILSIILAISSFSPLVTFAEDIIITDPATKDIYLNVDSDTGYDATELVAAVESEIVRLGGNDAPSVRIKTNNTQIDTTDLSNWYVYDHYDTAYWTARATSLFANGQIVSNDASLAWKKDFAMDSLTDIKRPYTGQTYAEVYGSVYKIQDYLNTNLSGGVQKLDQHIYSGVDSNGAFMTFLGYGIPAYMDYLFYPDTLSGTKTVTYTIDSNNVSTHTLSSSGFLINTGIDASGFIRGYILVYAYTSNTSYTLNLYPIKSGITPQALSNGTSALTTYLDASVTPITSGALTTYTSTDVTLTIKPDSIKVEHKSPQDTNFTTMKEWTGLTTTGYNGFGPYVKYTPHNCYLLTSYKFTNLKMSSSTDAGSLVSAFASLQNADYLENQQIDRYLVNILGANSAYDLTNDSDYLALVQQKQINLFTNKEVSEIDSYLPSYLVDSTSSSLSQLATSIAQYILGITPGTNSDVPTTPVVTSIVANFTLKSGDVQVSQIKRNLIPSEGIVLDVTNSTIVPSGVTLGDPTFTLTKPSGSVSTVTVPFTVFNDTTNWPTGEYILTMDYGPESIPCAVKFLVLEDTTAPSVSAEKNGNVVDLNFTNTASVGNHTFTSELDSYVIIMTSTSAIPTSDWTNEVSIIDYAPEPITQAGYMHVLVKDSAGNIGHTLIQIVQVFPTIDTLPIASGIDYGQPLSASSLSGGRAIYNNEVVSGTFTWTNSTIKPTAGTENNYSVTFTPISAFYATITTNVMISVSKVTPEISLSDKTTSYTGSQISIDPAVVVGVAGVEAPTGTVSYTYYTDISCTTLTTNGNSGAASNGAAPVKAGTYYAKATIAGTTNYTSATTAAPGTFIILPTSGSDLLITGVPGLITYGDSSFSLTSTGGSGNGEVIFTSSNPQVASITQDGYVTIKKVGSTDIRATKVSDGNYESQYAAITLSVVPKEITYTITSNTKPYTGDSIYAAIMPNISTLVEGFDYIVTYSQNAIVVEEPTEAGEYEITVTTLNSNYTGESTGAKLTIQSVDQTYTLQIGGLPSYIEYEDTFALYANGGNGEGEINWVVTSGDTFATVSSSGLVKIIGVGSVTITLTKAGDGNYNEQIQSATFIANKKEIAVTISETAKTYNGTIQAVSVNGTQTLNNTLADILDVSYVMQTDTTQTTFRNVGTYNVSAAVKAELEDLYVLQSDVSAVATIGKTNIVITAVDKTKTYGDSNPALTMDYTLAGTDEDVDFIFPSVTCSATEDSNVGDYDIILSYEERNVNSNYHVVLVNGIMTINKAQLSVTADEKNVRYNSSTPQYTVSYEGFVLDQTPSVLEGALAVECSYTKGDDIGTYTITPSWLTSGNYEITFVNGVLNVSELPVTITATGSTSTITLQLVPAVSGLTQTNFIILQGEEEITPTRISERDGGSKYYISAPLTAEKEYTIVVNYGNNYVFNPTTFISKPPVSSGGGGGSVYVEPIIQSTLTFNIGKINSYQKIGSNNPIVHIMDAAPIISENRTLLPIRFVVEPLGGTIEWDAVEKKVTIVKDDIKIELWIGNHIAKVNGLDTMIDPQNENVKPIIVEPGRTMLPIRFISETLGCTVEWNEEVQEVTVRY